MGRWLKTSGVVVLLLAAVPGWISLNSRDLPSVDDSGLRVERWNLDADENALTHLAAAARALAWPDDDVGKAEIETMLSGTASNDRLEALLKRNSKTLLHLDRALSTARLQFPEYAFDGGDFESFDWRALGALLALRANAQLQAGDDAQAWDSALDPVRLGSAVEGAQGAVLVHTMVAVVLRAVGVRQLRLLAERAPLDRESGRLLARRIDALRADATAWRRVWAEEYQTLSQALALEFDKARKGEDRGLPIPTPGGLGEAYVLHPNRTRSGLADHYRELQQTSQRVCVELPNASSQDAPEGLALLRIVLAPNSIGEILLNVATPDVTEYLRRRCHVETQISALQALVGLQAWGKAHGALPDLLSELVPDYLDAIPRDGFDGTPLRYSRRERKLWSVGADGIDAGGHGGGDLDEMSEPTFSIGFQVR